ncbi:hypothetical protein [Virgibacillus sp. DJP39]|uniref:hypothetical protein n=1 Tax=Virgibacillus sp. DJP39 TaxID=3409790 RepID=UPI003BB5F3EB
MIKKSVFIASIFCVLVILSGCSEGANVNGQKQIDFSFTATGDSENWNVTDDVTGTYYNIEQLISESHDITIQPKTTIASNQIDVSIKIGEELIGIHDDEAEQTKFVAEIETDGSYTIKQSGFTRTDDNDKFWDEDIKIIIKHGNIKEEVKLN